jgi:Apea-like HEPN
VSTYRKPKGDTIFHWDVTPWEDLNRLRAIRSALHLLQDDESAEGLHVRVQYSKFPFIRPIVYKDHPLISSGDSVDIAKDSIGPLRRLFGYLLRTNSFQPGRIPRLPKPLSTALFHFEESMEGMKGWAEQAMELTIALEILFGAEAEQKFRLATRVALLLGVNDTETKLIFKQVQAMYDARSIPAHGKETKDKDWRDFVNGLTGAALKRPDARFEDYLSSDELVEINEACCRARDIVRRALISCIRLMDHPDSDYAWPFKKQFDARLLSNSDRRKFQRVGGVKRKISF